MRVLIVSLDAYSLFDPSTKFIFGGAELRAFHFANELAKYPDVEVTIVTRDQSRKVKEIGGVRVVPHPSIKGEGYWEKQKKLSTRIKNRIGGSVTGKETQKENTFFFESLKPTHVLILGMSPMAVECQNFCEAEKRLLIFGCASDFDLSEKYLEQNSPLDISGNDASGYAKVIRSASLVFVQSHEQDVMIEKRFGRKGILLPNPISLKMTRNNSDAISLCDVLWVGKTSPIKKPELFIELAKLLPNLSFRMIMNNTNQEEWNKLFDGRPSNVELIESVPAESVENYFERTRIFVNTSTVEGFPNTFLQAGKYGIPVVSMLVDPNQILSERGCGIFSGDDIISLKDSVLKLLNDKKFYIACSENIRFYVASNHEISAITKQLYDAIIHCKPIVE